MDGRRPWQVEAVVLGPRACSPAMVGAADGASERASERALHLRLSLASEPQSLGASESVLVRVPHGHRRSAEVVLDRKPGGLLCCKGRRGRGLYCCVVPPPCTFSFSVFLPAEHRFLKCSRSLVCCSRLPPITGNKIPALGGWRLGSSSYCVLNATDSVWNCTVGGSLSWAAGS